MDKLKICDEGINSRAFGFSAVVAGVSLDALHYKHLNNLIKFFGSRPVPYGDIRWRPWLPRCLDVTLELSITSTSNFNNFIIKVFASKMCFPVVYSTDYI